MSELTSDEQIRIKALEIAARIRAAAISRSFPLDLSRQVIADAKEFERYIKDGR